MILTAIIGLCSLFGGGALIGYGVKEWRKWGWNGGVGLAPFLPAAGLIGVGVVAMLSLLPWSSG